MNKRIVNLSLVLSKEQEKKWVALSLDNKCIVDHDDNLLELDKRIGVQKVIFMKVPSSSSYHSYQLNDF